jgi:hypothetical protein
MFIDDEGSGLELYNMSEAEDRPNVSRVENIGTIPNTKNLGRIRVALKNKDLKLYKEGMEINQPKIPIPEGPPRSPEEARGDYYFDSKNGLMISKEKETEAYKILNKNSNEAITTIQGIKSVELLEHLLSLESRGISDYFRPRRAVIDAIEARMKAPGVSGFAIKKDLKERQTIYLAK